MKRKKKMSPSVSTAIGKFRCSRSIQPRTFARYLLVSMVLGNLFFVLSATYFLQQSRYQYQKQAEFTTSNLAQILMENTVGVIDKVDIALLSVVDEYAEQGDSGRIDKKRLASHISRVQSRLPRLLRSTGIVDEFGKGFLVADFGKSVPTKVDVSDRDYFLQLRDTDYQGLYISKPIHSRISDQWALVFARRLSHPDGSFAGLVYAGMPLENYIPTLSSVDMGKLGVVSLRDAEMGLIARHPEYRAIGADIGSKSVSVELQHLLQKGHTEGTYYTSSGADGIARMISFRKIGNYPLFVIIGVSEEEYLDDWRASLLKIIVLVGFFFLTTVVLARLLYLAWKRQAESEQQLKTIVDTEPECVKILDKDGRLLQINRAGLNLIEAETEEQVLGAQIVTLVAPNDRADFNALNDRVLRGKPGALEFEIVGLKGGHRWLDTRAVPWYSSNGKVIGLLGVTRDITEKKMAAEAIQLSENRLIRAELASKSGNWELHLDTRRIFASLGAATLYGVPAGQFDLATAQSFVLPEYRQLLDRSLKDLIETNAAYAVEFKIRVGGCGDVRDIRSVATYDTEKRVVFGIVQDITERKQYEQRLIESEERYRLLAEHSHDVIFTIDLGTGNVSYISPSIERLSAYSPAEIMARRIEEALTTESIAVSHKARQEMLSKIASGERTHLTDRYEIGVLHRDGHVIHAEVVTTYILNDVGKPVSVLGMLRDITERKKAEFELEQLARTDALTGLANRRNFMERAEIELSRAQRYGGQLSLLMMDLDHFKNINDTYGHQIGDQVLQKLGRLCLDILRDVDVIGRLGGEEFAVMLPQTDDRIAFEVAERLRTAIEKAEIPLKHGIPLHFSISIGVSALNNGQRQRRYVAGTSRQCLVRSKKPGA